MRIVQAESLLRVQGIRGGRIRWGLNWYEKGIPSVSFGSTRFVLDPICTNDRATRAYEKCGFRKVKLLAAKEWHEGAYRDCWLMAITKSELSSWR